MTSSLARLYHQFRAHQRKVCTAGRGCLTVYPSGRTEMTYASAPYGEHAMSAIASARSHKAFLARMRH